MAHQRDMNISKIWTITKFGFSEHILKSSVMKRISKKCLTAKVIHESLNELESIKPFIHRIKLSGDYNYPELLKLGNLKVVEPIFYRHRGYNEKYRTHAYCQLPEGRLLCSLNPYPSYYPWCMISITNPSIKLLNKISNELDFFSIAEVEYTIDFFCRNQQACHDIFYLFVRYLYFPYTSRVIMAGGKFDGWREPRKTNAVYKSLSIGKTRSKYIKVYERGPDTKKQFLENGQPFWYSKDIDRVRIEFTHYSRGTKLKNAGVWRTFSTLINGKTCNYLKN